MPKEVALLGHLAYVATDVVLGSLEASAGLAIIDVEDPAQPRLVARVDYPDGLADVVVADGRAYLATEWPTSLQVLDLSQPDQPRELGRVELGLGTSRLAVDGNRVYAGYDVVDVSDPMLPRLLEPVATGVDLPNPPSDFAPAGDVVGFTASGYNAVNNLAYLRWKGEAGTPATTTTVECPPEQESLGIARVGEWFLTVGNHGGCVFDAPVDGSAPQVHGFSTPGAAWP